MTFAVIVDKFLSGDYPVPMMILIVIIGGLVLALFSKRMLNKLNIATKDDIAELREEMKSGLLQLKENDLFHTNKAILLMARALITDEPTYGRIKDAILENTTDRLRGDLRDI